MRAFFYVYPTPHNRPSLPTSYLLLPTKILYFPALIFTKQKPIRMD